MSQRSGKKPTSLFRQIYEIPYNDSQKIKLYNSAQGSLDMVQRLAIHKKLPIHNGCVNCICWSENGEYLLSGSDDHHLVVTNVLKDFKTEIKYQTYHRANIFNAKFLPHRNHTSVISCSGDGLITFSDLNIPVLPSQLATDLNCFSCHSGTVYELATIPHDPNTFLSAGEDDTVRCFDLRVKSACHKVACKDDILVQCGRAVTTLSINEVAPYQLAIGTADSTVRIFDRRMMGTVADGYSAQNTRPVIICSAPGMDNRAYRITSVAFSPDGHEVLASYSSEYLYLFNIQQTEPNPQQFSQDFNSKERTGGRVKEKSCPVRRLRLRGDWSDTGPHARPEREGEPSPLNVHLTVMQRMTDLLTRILNDPMTRAAIASGDRDQEPQDQDSVLSEGESETSSQGQDTPSETTTDAEETMDSEPTLTNTLNPITNNDTLNPTPSNNTDTSNLSTISSNVPDSMDTESSSNTSNSDDTPNTSTFVSNNTSNISNPTSIISIDQDSMGTESTSNSDDTPNTSTFVSNKTSTISNPTSIISNDQDNMETESTSNNLNSDYTPKSNTSIISNVQDGMDTDRTSNTLNVNNETNTSPFVSTNTPTIAISTSNISTELDVMDTESFSSNSSYFNPTLHTSSSNVSTFSSNTVLHDLIDTQQGLNSISLTSNTSTLTDEPNTSITSVDDLNTPKSRIYENVPHTSENVPYISEGVANSSESANDPTTLNRSDSAINTEESSSNSAQSLQNTSLTSNTSNVTSLPPNTSNSTSITAFSTSNTSNSIPITSHSSSNTFNTTPNVSTAENEMNMVDQSSDEETRRVQADLFSASTSSRRRSRKQRGSGFCDEYATVGSMKQKFTGHRNARTMIKQARFWGSQLVMSGSDCGHVFIWDRYTGALVNFLEADDHVVNCVQPHPTLPLLATSGIDYDVKIWEPNLEEPRFSMEMAQLLMKRNEIMLEETKDTITVPASFMIRMLACLNQIRRGSSLIRAGTSRNATESNE